MWRTLGLFLLLAGLAAQTPKYGTCVSSEQLRHYATVSGPRLSPDGRQVVWTQREPTADGAASHIWLAPSDGSGAARQITFSPASDKGGESGPEWMPDGSAILFTARRGETRQIFRLPLAAGGEAAPIELKDGKLEISAGSFEISPDGKWLAVRASQPLTEAEKKDEKDKKDAAVQGEETHPSRIWLYSFATGKTTAITPLDRSAGAVAWSPDSQELAIVTETPGDASDVAPNARLEMVSVAGPHAARTIAGPPATISAVAFSPDGSQLAFLAQTPHDAPPGISAVYVMPAAGGTPRSLSADSSLEVAGREIIWRKDGQAVYMQAQQRTHGALIAFPLDGQPAWQAAVAPIANSFSTDRNQDGWAFVAQGPEHLPEIEFAASPTAPGRALSNANPAWAQTGWRAAEEVSWTGPDNLAIEGLYYPPARCPGAAATTSDGKSPMILVVHGGPTGSFVQTFSPFIQWLTSQGWSVLEPNPRGSTGYGWQFAAADRNDLGGKDFEDIMAGVDWALAHKPVDAARLGMYGYSYGGEMAGFLEGKTDRFRAIVSGAPVIDQYSEYGTEGGSWYDRWFFGQPWLRPQDAWRQSPLSYAGKAKTPLLLLQGEADTTDPLGQSLEMYRALRQMGVEVRLVKFPRENHGPLSGGINGAPSPEPWHGFRGRAEILRWFRSHFQKRP